MAKRYSPKLKFQVVLELLEGIKTVAQVAKAYGIHPNTASGWKRDVPEKGPKIFAQDSTVTEHERRIAELEQLMGKKEVETVLLKKSLRPDEMSTAEKAELIASV